VGVDEPRTDDAAFRLDHGLGLGAGEVTDGGNAVPADSQVRPDRRRPRPVENLPVPDEKIEFHDPALPRGALE